MRLIFDLVLYGPIIAWNRKSPKTILVKCKFLGKQICVSMVYSHRAYIDIESGQLLSGSLSVRIRPK